MTGTEEAREAARVDDALIRRIEMAIFTTAVSREAIEFHWPECHKPRCQGTHGRPEEAMGIVLDRVAESVKGELRWRLITRPDVSGNDTDDDPALLATYTLAALLNRYNVHHAGTFVRAARLIIDAYPTLVPALAAIDALEADHD